VIVVEVVLQFLDVVLRLAARAVDALVQDLRVVL